MSQSNVLPIRGYMLHLSHYDPRWCRRKSREKPIDVAFAVELVEAMAPAGLNLLVIDCADGVKYGSHPELARPYSIPMRSLKRIVSSAERNGIEVVPKLNFARSPMHQHNQWFRPHDRHFDDNAYWKTAFEVIDELIGVTRPRRFFHVGMDEDHTRSYNQYADAICTLHAGLKRRRLRTVMWKDSHDWPATQCHTEKALWSERKIPRDVVQVPWDYKRVQTGVIRRLARKGFAVWGAPGPDPHQVRTWRETLLRSGGQGILLTRWVPCRPGNRKNLLHLVRDLGPICAEN